MSFEMRWLGTACFELVPPSGLHILIDPYLDESINSPIKNSRIEACDYLFITHGHWDHVLDVGALARRFDMPIYCNRATASSLVEHQGLELSRFRVLKPGDRLELGGFKLEVLAGVHTDPVSEYQRITGKPMPGPEEFNDPLARAKALLMETAGTDRITARHLEWRSMYPGGEQLNFVFELGDGHRIYMAGSYPDPLVMEEAKKARADITLMQCMSSNKLAGLEKSTAEVIMASGCRTAIPQHHDPIYAGGWRTDLSKLRKLMEKAGIAFIEMIPGEWYMFHDGRMK